MNRMAVYICVVEIFVFFQAWYVYIIYVDIIGNSAAEYFFITDNC